MHGAKVFIFLHCIKAFELWVQIVQESLDRMTQKGFESNVVRDERFCEVGIEGVDVLIVAKECGGEG
jgi:hypothetical protein